MHKDKTTEELKAEIKMRELLDKERERSDQNYAPMIIKTIVYGFITIILLAVGSALIGLIFK